MNFDSKRRYVKKLILSFGSAAAIIAPVVTVVACGDDAESNKINGKTAAEIKALTVAQFNDFIADTLLKAQPDTKNTSVKFTLSGNQKSRTLEYTDTKGATGTLDITDVKNNKFLSNLGIYTSVPIGSASTDAQAAAGGQVKAWWKDVVDAFKVYLG